MDFLVLPDHPASDALLRCLPASPSRHVFRHPSGRPWIVGHWSPDEVLTAEAGPRRIALLGTASATPDTLTRLLHGPGHLDGIGERARRIPGSHFVLSAVDGDLRCQGDLATVRQLHHARIGGVTVAGNRPQDLAALARGAALAGLPLGTPGIGFIDEESLALRLLFPFPPLPLTLRPLWHSVPAVPPGHHLTLYANGRHSLARWWQPPEPEVPLEQAAQTVRQALADAVAARAGRARRQAAAAGGDEADGSGGTGGTGGGKDRGTLSVGLSPHTAATGLCFLAAREDVRLIATSWAHRAPAGDAATAWTDGTLWTDRTAALLRAPERPHARDTEVNATGTRGRARNGGSDRYGRDGTNGRINSNGRISGNGKTSSNGAGPGNSRRQRTYRGKGRAEEPSGPPHSSVTHLSLPYADAPTWYAPPPHPVHTLQPVHTSPAAPLAAFREAARLLHRSRLVAEHGSRLHLDGAGGDALFDHRTVALNSLARRDPRAAARRAWTAHHLCGWTAPDTLRTLLGGRPYSRWLAGGARRLSAGAGPRKTGADWETVPGMPPWAHPDAVATVRRLLREAAAEQPEPFGPLRSQHETVRAAIRAGETVRGVAALTAPYGVGYEAPFLDDAVIEAALTLHLADRTRPGVHQPLLTRALRGIVPDGVLGRGPRNAPTPGPATGPRTGPFTDPRAWIRTKVHAGTRSRTHSLIHSEIHAEIHADPRAHRDDLSVLSALCDDSLLADRGLIRPDLLRHHLTSRRPHPHTPLALAPTLATEYWLRALAPDDVPTPSVRHHR
ncbi:asparagine synthase-related protein [Streptomyces sp. NPDC001339]|uniref:asparagine synthase-related protein n=1 Tax=Streptomyces sp. NPDC001339 TaxID=3364563 RepID=UPI0036AECDD2